MKIDPKLLLEHRVEFAYLLNHYLTEHLVRVSRAFDGDLSAAVVLGTIAHHNLRRFHEEVVAKSSASMSLFFSALMNLRSTGSARMALAR